jgi:hypothetical protein
MSTMKRIAFALVASAAALAASSARADTRVRVGVNIGSPGYYPPAPVVVSAPAVVYAPPPAVVYATPPAVIVAPTRGYWQDVQVKTWVPERWVVRHNRWGRAERYCEPGYYTFRTERVWVDGRHDHGRSHDYGYRSNDNYRYNDNRGWNR